MRLRQPLDDLVRGQTSVRVLRLICLFPEKEFTGRELAGMAGSPPSKVIAELERLRTAGIVDRRTIGRTHLWATNASHVLVAALAPAFAAEHEILATLRQVLQAGTDDPRITRVILFGSVARHEEKLGSDLDLLVTVKWPRDVEPVGALLEALSVRLRTLFGLRLSPILHAEEELAQLRRSPLLKSVVAEGEILRGKPLG